MKPDPDLTSAFRVGVQWAWKEKVGKPSPGRGYLPPGRPEPILNAPTCWNHGASVDGGGSGKGKRRRKERRGERPERKAFRHKADKRRSWESAAPFSTLTVGVSKGSAWPAHIWMMFSSGAHSQTPAKTLCARMHAGREHAHTHAHTHRLTQLNPSRPPASPFHCSSSRAPCRYILILLHFSS